MTLDPTPELRYRRARPDEIGPLLVLQQLWTGHHMGDRHSEWRDVPVEGKPQ